MINKATAVHMGRKDGLFIVETNLFLPRPLELVFGFFADAANLQTITPPWLRFEILTPVPISMQEGSLIEYRLRLHGIPMRWQSEITVWKPPFRFVDEQRRGPYRKWVHEHTFTGCRNGTEVRDHVQYDLSGGRLVNALFVRRDVRQIFEYRTRKLRDLFMEPRRNADQE